MFKKLGLAALGLFLILIGVNIAPTVYTWQGQVYDWTYYRVVPPRPQDNTGKVLDAIKQMMAGRDRWEQAERQQWQARAAEEAQPEPSSPGPVVAPRFGDMELDALRARVKAVEDDQKRLTELVLEAKREAGQRAVVPVEGPHPVGTFDQLMASVPVGRIAVQQEDWLHTQNDYGVLKRRGMSDYQILRRIGNPEVWALGH